MTQNAPEVASSVVTVRRATVRDYAPLMELINRVFFKSDPNAFQTILPNLYLRREDYIRGQSTIEAKLDAIATELKMVQIKGSKV